MTTMTSSLVSSEPFTTSVFNGMTFEDCLRAAIKLHTGTGPMTRDQYKGEIDDITGALMDLGLDWDDLANTFEALVKS